MEGQTEEIMVHKTSHLENDTHLLIQKFNDHESSINLKKMTAGTIGW